MLVVLRNLSQSLNNFAVKCFHLEESSWITVLSKQSLLVPDERPRSSYTNACRSVRGRDSVKCWSTYSPVNHAESWLTLWTYRAWSVLSFLQSQGGHLWWWDTSLWLLICAPCKNCGTAAAGKPPEGQGVPVATQTFSRSTFSPELNPPETIRAFAEQHSRVRSCLSYSVLLSPHWQLFFSIETTQSIVMARRKSTSE